MVKRVTDEHVIRAVRVLCVDDNRDAADSEALALKAYGFEARACYDGPSALTLAEEFCPDVCLLDLNMPGMDGDELAGRLRAWAADRPLLLVAVTGMSDAASKLRIEAAGFDNHFVKPADLSQIVAVLEKQ